MRRAANTASDTARSVVVAQLLWGGGFGGQTGVLRMFETQGGGQIAWLLTAALVLLVAALVLLWRAPRADRTRAGLILWGGWLLVTALSSASWRAWWRRHRRSRPS